MSTGARKYTRSVSQLKSYSRCSEQFRLERLVRPRLPARPASWFAGGTAFHTATEMWERRGRTDDLAEMFEEQYWEQIDQLKERQPDPKMWIKPPRSTVENDIKNRLRSGLDRWIPNYLTYCEQSWEFFELPDGEPAIEVEFEVTLGGDDGVKVTGSIDRILWWPQDEAVTIEDLKTGNREDSYTQLGLYAFVANSLKDALFLPKEIEVCRYFYAKDGSCSDWQPVARYTAEYLAEVYRSLDIGISNRVFIPNPGDACGLCGVQEWCREKGYLQEGEEWR